MTYEWMQEQVTAWLGLQDIDPLDETQLAKQLIYDGTIDLLSRTRCTVRCLDLTIKEGVSQYHLEHAVLALVDVENGARPRARRNETTCGPSFTLVRSDVLLIQPTPSEDGVMQTWAVMRPVPMSMPTQSPGEEQFGGIPDEYHDAIVTYALWKASDYADDQTGAQGERYRMLYEGQDGRGGRIAQIKMLVNKRGTAKAPRMRVRLPVGVSSHDSWVG